MRSARILFVVAFGTCSRPVLSAEDASPYLRFNDRSEHVELVKTRGAIDLQKSFTIEVWARWDTEVLTKQLYIAGDEMWKGMSDELPVIATTGWVLRTTPVKNADKQAIEFNVACTPKGKRGEWLSIFTSYERVDPKQWQHIAVERIGDEVRIYWNGKLSARREVKGIELNSSPSNIYLGVRKGGYKDREFAGDIRAFRLSSTARYQERSNPELPTKSDDATLSLLDMSKADGDIIPDGSGHDRCGKIVGARISRPAEKK